MAVPKLGRLIEERVKEKIGAQMEMFPDFGKAETVNITTVTTGVGPDGAAKELYKYLPESVREMLDAVVRERGYPLWQVMLGHVVRAYDRRELFAPFILSDWESGKAFTGECSCEGCGKPFSSRFVGARFCCDRCAFGKLNEFGHRADCPVVAKELV